eukprot:PLAT503.1.p2 GENE.PLAT503.1~~PLAT503.1.p2  ORF type:complete len:126 (+),score=12.50 PLAT503.1:90-467(+)
MLRSHISLAEGTSAKQAMATTPMHDLTCTSAPSARLTAPHDCLLAPPSERVFAASVVTTCGKQTAMGAVFGAAVGIGTGLICGPFMGPPGARMAAAGRMMARSGPWFAVLMGVGGLVGCLRSTGM